MHKMCKMTKWSTYKILAATEGNIYLLDTLKKIGLYTNDVSSFVSKQSMHKNVNTCVDTKVKRITITMHSKLVDALAFPKRLRQRKNSEKKLVLKKYKNKKSLGRRILSDMVLRYKQTKFN